MHWAIGVQPPAATPHLSAGGGTTVRVMGPQRTFPGLIGRTGLRCALRSFRAAPEGALIPPPTPLEPFTGAIFDMDGTLVGSEFLTPLAWAAVLAEVGAQLPSGNAGVAEVAALISTPAMRGSDALTVAQKLAKHYEVSTKPPVWLAAQKKKVAVQQALSGDVDLAPLWFEGVREAVEQLAEKIGPDGLALCTSNLRPVVEATLEAGSMSRVFLGGMTVQEDLFDPEGGLRMKPQAYPYARALRLLGRPAGRTVVVEDSVVGVTSAAAAGAGVVLGVLNPEHLGTEGGDESAAASALHAAGAAGVFRNTTDAVAWAREHSCTQGMRINAAGTAGEAAAKEAVVRQYFAGVNTKDRATIRACFADTVQMRDMCGVSKGALREASADDMADRCMEFVAAHPDVRVFFESPPCMDRHGEWVWAHWAEEGTWSGESRGLVPQHTPLNVSGHTRFFLTDVRGKFKISKQVVYRTFSDWERMLTGM